MWTIFREFNVDFISREGQTLCSPLRKTFSGRDELIMRLHALQDVHPDLASIQKQNSRASKSHMRKPCHLSTRIGCCANCFANSNRTIRPAKKSSALRHKRHQRRWPRLISQFTDRSGVIGLFGFHWRQQAFKQCPGVVHQPRAVSGRRGQRIGQQLLT
jgi:hypothetical protein